MRRLFLLAALAACTKPDSAPPDTTAAAPATAPVVQITAKDFAFVAPDTIDAGMTTLEMLNEGPGIHHVFLVKLAEGKSVQDLDAALKAMKPGEKTPDWISDAGG